MWLHGVYIIDVAGMEADLPPTLGIKPNYSGGISGVVVIINKEY